MDLVRPGDPRRRTRVRADPSSSRRRFPPVAMASNEVEEAMKRINSHKGVLGVLIVNKDGIDQDDARARGDGAARGARDALREEDRGRDQGAGPRERAHVRARAVEESTRSSSPRTWNTPSSSFSTRSSETAVGRSSALAGSGSSGVGGVGGFLGGRGGRRSRRRGDDPRSNAAERPPTRRERVEETRALAGRAPDALQKSRPSHV